MNRRVLVLVLVGLGAFLLVTALGLRFVVLPSAQKAPLDQQSETVSTGTVDYLDIDAGRMRTDRPLEVLQRVVGDVEAGNDDVAVYDYFVRLSDPADGPTPEDQLITATRLRVPFDRVSGEVVEDAAEYGATPEELEGLVLKFPFDVQQDGDYSLFDTTLLEPVPLEFVGEENVGGLDAYVFRATVEPTEVGEPTDLPQSVTGAAQDYEDAVRVYSDERLLYVEPRTGVILQVEDQPLQVFQVDGETVLTAVDASFSRTEASVEDAVQTATDARSALRLVGTVLPWSLGLLGLVALLVAGVLATTGGSGGRRREEEPRDALLSDTFTRDTAAPTTELRPQPAASEPAASEPGASGTGATQPGGTSSGGSVRTTWPSASPGRHSGTAGTT